MSNGYSKCPDWLKLAYRKSAMFKCESCGKHEREVGVLQIHRIRRGSNGGTYIPHNCELLCSNCHKLMHYGEFR